MPLGLTAYRLANDIGIPQTRVSQIIKGERRITADTALRLSKYFGTTGKFWLGLQDDYDLEEEGLALRATLASIDRLDRRPPTSRGSGASRGATQAG